MISQEGMDGKVMRNGRKEEGKGKREKGKERQSGCEGNLGKT